MAISAVYINENNTKLYIPQNGKNYAIVNSNDYDELPLCFKADRNGSYTLEFSFEDINPEYLHLIDDMTGLDIDLLTTRSYSFDAHTSDLASRFRLVFNAPDDDNDHFAFISNGDIIISGEGLVQVIDVLGRQVYSHQVNSEFRIPNSEFTSGVYLLRLIQDDNARTQKIVIK